MAGSADRPHERAAQDVLDSIFLVATTMVEGQVSLLLRDDETSDFVLARAEGAVPEARRARRVRADEGVPGRVAATREPVVAGESLGVPVVVDEGVRGVLCVERAGGPPFAQADVTLVQQLAAHIAACLVQRAHGEALERLAETDPLTWLPNRRHFDRRLTSEAGRAVRSSALLALLMVDVDRFKSVNDRFGHRVGDAVLRLVAISLTAAIRPYDIACRYGGDEFAVILPEADTQVGAIVAQRIVDRLAAAPLPESLAAVGEAIGLSIGIATFPRPAADAAALVEAADAAMYHAKAAGGGVRVFEHAVADGPRGHVAAKRATIPHTPFLADPARLARPSLQALLPPELAEQWNVVVVGREGAVVTVAMPEPDPAVLEAISRETGLAVYPVYANPADLQAARRRLIAD